MFSLTWESQGSHVGLFLYASNIRHIDTYIDELLEIGESGASCNRFCSNPRGAKSAKSVEFLKLLFISLGSPLVAFERDILKLTKGCLMSEKMNLDKLVTTRPASKYVGRE